MSKYGHDGVAACYPKHVVAWKYPLAEPARGNADRMEVQDF
jgi:hypothetical protein